MKRYPDQEIENARNLRKKHHYSFALLQQITGIPATTIRNWCADDVLGTKWDTLLLTNERKRQQLKDSEKDVIKQFREADKTYTKIFLSLLYWCEGSKYPATNKTEFTNSDPQLQKLFITLLRRAFDIDESKFRIQLQIQDTHDLVTIKKFWSSLLNIPEAQFIKPTITKMKGGKQRKSYYGTCKLRYVDYRIQLKLTGIYEEISKQLKAEIYNQQHI